MDIKAGNHSITLDEPPKMGGNDNGPDPLNTFLSALAGCENVLANIVAKEINFDLQGIDFEIEGVIDPRGFMGDPTITPYFESITVDARVKTSEPQERIDQLQEETDSRCPVFTTLDAAGIKMISNWSKA